MRRFQEDPQVGNAGGARIVYNAVCMKGNVVTKGGTVPAIYAAKG